VRMFDYPALERYATQKRTLLSREASSNNIPSSRGPGQPPPAQQMHMEVEDGLSGAGADVEDGAVSVFDVPLAGDLRGDEVAAANDFCVGDLGLFQTRKMFPGNDENMGGRLRMNIFEGEHVIVFVNLFRGKLAADDAAEKAIGAGVSHWRVHRRNDNSIGRGGCQQGTEPGGTCLFRPEVHPEVTMVSFWKQRKRLRTGRSF